MKMILKQFIIVFLFAFSVSYAAMTPEQYADYLAKTVDDVVKTIHATVPNSKITHADILAIMCVEQGSLNISKNSHAGARGLTQVMPATFRQYARTNYGGFGDFVRRTGCTVNHLSFDVRCSIEAGARIFNYYLIQYNGDRAKAAIAYNAGPGKVNSARLPLETQKYVNYYFPRCFSNVKTGQAPFATNIWRRLVAQVSRLTGGKMALNGYASLIPYVVGRQPFTSFIANATRIQPPLLNSVPLLGGSSVGNTNSYSGISRIPHAQNTLARQASGNRRINTPQQRAQQQHYALYNPSEPSGRNYENEPLEVNDFDFSLSGQVAHETLNAYKEKADNKLPNSIDLNDSIFLACAPSFFEKGQAVLLSFYCPSGFVAESEFSSKNYGIVKLYPNKDKEYKLKCKKENKVLIKSCKVKLVEPKIDILKTEKTNGKIEISWSAKDISSCKLLIAGNSKDISLSGKKIFSKSELKNAKIICEAKNGLFIKKNLNDII